MSLAEKILSELGGISNSKNIRRNKEYIAGSMIFDPVHYSTVQKKLNSIIDEVARNGEKIVCEISSGRIVDSGVKGFEVLKGTSVEVYDYRATAAAFVRLYYIRSRKKDWLALYIDENQSTPWWSKEERK
ncbi:MAG: hypothetical protein ACE5NL_00190 [Candidatus Hydrothermarchaeaceae archaeon]